MRIRLGIYSVLGALTLGAGIASAADEPVKAPTVAPAPKPLSKTIGIDIVKLTKNPDNTVTALFRWKDSKTELMVERSVLFNENTIINIGGKFKTLADLTDDVASKNKAVATVGSDPKIAVMLRVGRAALKLTEQEEQALTAGQKASLLAGAIPPTEASNKAVDDRVAEMIPQLHLNAPLREARLTALLVENIRAVRDAHNAGVGPAKSVRDKLNAGLAADLTPEQIEIVKDLLTYNEVPRHFAAYHAIAPEITAEEDKELMRVLRLAREELLNVKNHREGYAPVLEPFKTQNENYLTAHGHNWKVLFKAYGDAQRAPRAGTTQPAANQPGPKPTVIN